MAIQSFKEAFEHDNQAFEVVVGDKIYSGFFANIRVDRRTLPEGWYAYDMRDSDDFKDVSQIRNGYIMVNHFGTFCTQTPLPLKDGESFYYYGDGDENNEFEYSFAG